MKGCDVMLRYVDSVKINCPDDWDEEKIQELKHAVELRNFLLEWEDYSIVEAYYDKNHVLQVECLTKMKMGEEPELRPELYPVSLKIFNIITILFVSLVCYTTYKLGISNWDAPNLVKTFYLLTIVFMCYIGKETYQHLQWSCQITSRQIREVTTFLDRKVERLLGIMQSLAVAMAILIWFID